MAIWMFVVAATIAGAATAFFGPASTGLVPETISPARPILASFALWSLGGRSGARAAAAGEIPADRLSRVSSFDWAISTVVMPICAAAAPDAMLGHSHPHADAYLESII